MGIDGAADLCHKIAAGKILAVRAALKQLFKQYGTPDAIDDLVARIVIKSFVALSRHPQHKVAIAQTTAAALPGQLDDKDTDDIIQKVIVERVLGMLLTPELRKELATLGPLLGEYGSVQLANLATAIAVTDDPEAIRGAVRDLLNVLRNREQLDDDLVKRAQKGNPRAVQDDPRHWAVLNDIIQACKPASATVVSVAAV